MKLARHLLACAALIVPVTGARAGDWYVDAVGGSNANTGSTPAAAWQTITHAFASIPAGRQTIHLLPGVYDAALGETFPLNLPADATLRGTGEPGDATIALSSVNFTIEVTPGGASTVERLTIRGFNPSQGAGLRLRANVFPKTTLVLRDLVLERLGQGLQADNLDPFTPKTTVVMERLSIEDCGFGINLRAQFDGLGLSASLTDSEVRDCQVGLRAENSGGFSLRVDVDRTSFLGCDDAGIQTSHTTTNGPSVLDVQSSLVAGGACDGISTFGWTVLIDGSTVAANTCVGVEQLGPGLGKISGSILYGNGDDLDLNVALTLENNDIGDGDLQGVNGNISVDPLFVDPANDDYRPGFATACIDALPPSATPPDLTGFPRDNDGDLDLAQGRDLGALELRNLTAPGTAALGTFWEVELHGPAGELALLHISRTGLLSTPIVTNFGSRWVPTTGTVTVGPLAFTGSGPHAVVLPMPAVPALAGTTLGLQAFTRNPAAPAGAAWGETAEVLVVP